MGCDQAPLERQLSDLQANLACYRSRQGVVDCRNELTPNDRVQRLHLRATAFNQLPAQISRVHAELTAVRLYCPLLVGHWEIGASDRSGVPDPAFSGDLDISDWDYTTRVLTAGMNLGRGPHFRDTSAASRSVRSIGASS